MKQELIQHAKWMRTLAASSNSAGPGSKNEIKDVLVSRVNNQEQLVALSRILESGHHDCAQYLLAWKAKVPRDTLASDGLEVPGVSVLKPTTSRLSAIKALASQIKKFDQTDEQASSAPNSSALRKHLQDLAEVQNEFEASRNPSQDCERSPTALEKMQAMKRQLQTQQQKQNTRKSQSQSGCF